MKKTLLLLLLIYAVSSQGQSTLPDFMIFRPFYGMEGKVKSLETRYYNKYDIEDIEAMDEYDHSYGMLQQVYFNRAGSVDSMLQVFNVAVPEKTIIKTYYKNNVPEEEWSGVIADNDTIYKTKTEMVYEKVDNNSIRIIFSLK